MEEALYDCALLRRFAQVDLGNEPVPDETTICCFRHLLEEHSLGSAIMTVVNQYLQRRGLTITTGTIVDATIIRAPSSTKNADQQRDPELPQTKKGKQWYFGVKAHVGVDSRTKIIPTAVVTAANVADSVVLAELLPSGETKVWDDQAYRGQAAAIHQVVPRAQDMTSQRYRYKNRIDDVEREKNRHKSRGRSRVEQVFAVIKLQFGYVKARYRGLQKNANQIFTLAR